VSEVAYVRRQTRDSDDAVINVRNWEHHFCWVCTWGDGIAMHCAEWLGNGYDECDEYMHMVALTLSLTMRLGLLERYMNLQ
jgi:hypothetical protein